MRYLAHCLIFLVFCGVFAAPAAANEALASNSEEQAPTRHAQKLESILQVLQIEKLLACDSKKCMEDVLSSAAGGKSGARRLFKYFVADDGPNLGNGYSPPGMNSEMLACSGQPWTCPILCSGTICNAAAQLAAQSCRANISPDLAYADYVIEAAHCVALGRLVQVACTGVCLS